MTDYPAVGLFLESLGEPWKREHIFHPTRKWRLDYALVERRIGIEIEGAVWTGGRHTRGSGFVADMEKYNELAILGWRLLRFTPANIKKGTFKDPILRLLD